MKPVALKRVWWPVNVDLGDGRFEKSSTASENFKLWYLGSLILLERPGKPDRAFPVGVGVVMEPLRDTSPEEWLSGAGPRSSASQMGTPGGAPDVTAGETAKKRGPGRPPKGEK